ncbi:Phage derived protein Gp49-like [Streptomyces aidingensis]|uniref:Phage derived protein Gp49-like n=2 Tax=Streptomyces aidingensis TaxID=910347 RepID=A0A1I1UHB0_9ACTN|nr:Phage derived protein Gp49-like [Streptomyces aidingensis]
MYSIVYIVECMDEGYAIEVEPEVRDWLELLPLRLYRRVEDKADRLLAEPTTLGEPYSRHLGGKLRELRMTLDGDAVRIPYWLTPDRRIVLLTVFRKTRMREAAEIERAHQAQKVCETEHGPAQHIYDRTREA